VKSAITLVVFIGLAFLTGGVGGGVTVSALETWYPSLTKPALNPPDAVFGIVWPILFVLMSIAAWLVWREGWRAAEGVKRALRLHFWQLLVNMGWSVVFFGLQSPLWAIPVVLLLWVLVAWMAREYRAISAPAFWLTMPYLAWITFAAYLNVAITVLNR